MFEFQKTLPSATQSQKLRELKEKFENVADEKTLEVHKRLEELIK